MEKFKWMRLSLYYPATILSVSGLGLLLVPSTVLDLLFSSVQYDPFISRMSGMFMLVLSVFVFKTIRHSFTEVYVWTIYLRLFMAVCLIIFFRQTANPLFLSILAILSTGILLSFAGLMRDKNSNSQVF